MISSSWNHFMSFPPRRRLWLLPLGLQGVKSWCCCAGKSLCTAWPFPPREYLHVQSTASHPNPAQTAPAHFPSSCSRCAGSGQLWVTQGHRAHEEQGAWSSQLAPGKGDKNENIKQIFWCFCWFASRTHKILSKQGDALFQTHLSLFQT